MAIKRVLLAVLFVLFSGVLFAEGGEEESYSDVMMHHVLESHDWHITDIPSGDGNYTSIGLHLPWLFYSSRDGVVFYMNTHAMLEDGQYSVSHEGLAEQIVALKAGAGHGGGHDDGHGEHETHDGHGEHGHEGHDHGHEEHGDHGHEGHDHEGETSDHHQGGHHGHINPADIDEAVTVIDFSPSKTVLQMFLIGLLLVFVFTRVAKRYAANRGAAPSGMQSFFEPVIEFVRDDIAKNYLHDKAEKFLPYLLTLFFFIWFSNLFGLTPLNSNIMGNISVTAALAFLTFIITQFSGTKDYWQHIFNMPGVPVFVKPLTLVVEVLGLFTKPFALAIRLFANITAGHFMVLSLIGLIFILGENGKNAVGAFGIMPLSVVFTIVIFGLELIVATIQAYVFTLLTAVFVGIALEDHSHHEDHAHHH